MGSISKSPRTQLLTIRQVADHLQVCERTVRRWIQEGKLRAMRIGRGWRIHPRDLDRLLHSQ